MAKGLYDSIFSSISERIAEYKTQMLQEFVPIYANAKYRNENFDLTKELIKTITEGKKNYRDAYSSAAKAINDEKENFSIKSLDLSALCTILIVEHNFFYISNHELRFCVKRLKNTRNFMSHKSFQEPEEIMFQTLVGALYDIEEFFTCLYQFDDKKKSSFYTGFIDSNRINLEIIRRDLFDDFITTQKYKFDIEYIINLPNPYDAASEFHYRLEQYSRDSNGKRNMYAGESFLKACEIAELEPAFADLASYYRIIKKDDLRANLFIEKGKEFSRLLERTSEFQRHLKFTNIKEAEVIATLEKEFPNYFFRIEKAGYEKKVYCYKKNKYE